jgi:pyrroline-5-carboxylate reductase
VVFCEILWQKLIKEEDMLKDKIGFIGAGNMGEALVKGVLKAELLSPQGVYASDIREVRLQKLQYDCGITTFKDNKELILKARIIVLAVKPQNMEELLSEIAPVINKEHLVISIAAGITTPYIARHFKGEVPIIRVMPNTPALIQEGASALAGGKGVSKGDLDIAQRLFDSVGKTVVVDESLMDAVTGLSGSGPAYFFLFIEILTDAGVKVGLPRSIALQLSTQTCLGAARMIFETGEKPDKLRDMVTSKGGTTISGLIAMEAGNIRKTIIDGVEAATRRSKELGKTKK